MTVEIIIVVAAIALLLMLSGFFSGSETALTAASKAEIHRLARAGDVRAIRVEQLIEDRESLIGGILLGNNLVNILASALATWLFIQLVGEEGVIYATLVMTALVLIFAEVLPKTYAILNSVKMALAVGRAIQVVVFLFSPIVRAVRAIVRVTLKLFGIDISRSQAIMSAEEELRGAIDLQVSEGRIVKERRDMLGSILDLDDVLVGDIMVHRKNMVMLNAEDRPADIVSQVIRSPFTRLPLWQEEPENIVGVLHAKDLLRAFRGGAEAAQTVDVQRLMTKPWFVPETTTLREQLDAFLDRRAHFALVVDEYGAIMGLVTLEDILEEIVGEITDEHDFRIEGLAEQADGSVIADGTVTIRDLNRQLDWDLPDEDANTVAGLVLHESEIIPVVGQKFSFHGYDFEIMGRRRNQLTRLKVRKQGEQ